MLNDAIKKFESVSGAILYRSIEVRDMVQQGGLAIRLIRECQGPQGFAFWGFILWNPTEV